MAQFLPNRSPRSLREWMRTGSMKNFSRAMEEAQEMLQLISGHSNARLYKGAGVELSFLRLCTSSSRQEQGEGYFQGGGTRGGKGGIHRECHFKIRTNSI